jgi:hypothetical protein
VSAAEITSLLSTTGGYGIASLALLAVWYFYRRVEALQAEIVMTLKADRDAQLALLVQTVPLSTKLAEGIQLLAREVEALERITDACRGGKS